MITVINATTYNVPTTGDRLIAPVITLGGKDPKKFAPNLNIGIDFVGGASETPCDSNAEVEWVEEP